MYKNAKTKNTRTSDEKETNARPTTAHLYGWIRCRGCDKLFGKISCVFYHILALHGSAWKVIFARGDQAIVWYLNRSQQLRCLAG